MGVEIGPPIHRWFPSELQDLQSFATETGSAGKIVARTTIGTGLAGSKDQEVTLDGNQSIDFLKMTTVFLQADGHRP